MKLSDMVLEMIERKLEDPEAVRKIRNSIIVPSINMVHEELRNSESQEMLSTLAHGVLWPVLSVVLVTLFVSVVLLILLNVQVYCSSNIPK